MEEFNWEIIRKLSLLVLFELFAGCHENINVFTQMYGGTFGNVNGDENFMEDENRWAQNQGVIILNPEAF